MKTLLCFVVLALCTPSYSHAASSPISLEAANAALASQDYAKALEGYIQLAEKGDAQAQMRLGQMYEGGVGTGSDMAKAAEWYLKAAEQGHSAAQTSIGYFYELGIGVEKDLQKAVEWYSTAAELGHARAQNNLGVMYLKDDGIPVDIARGKKLLERAASQGLALAQDNLARLSGDTPGDTGQQGIAGETTSPASAKPSPAVRSANSTAADFRLFDTSLYSAQREDFRNGIVAWSVPVRDNQDPLCDSYDASSLIKEADTLEVCYNNDGLLQTIRYIFPVPPEQTKENLHKVANIKDMVAERHGEPKDVKGYRNKGPVYYGWNKSNVRVLVERQWPDLSVQLQYTVHRKDGAPRKERGAAY